MKIIGVIPARYQSSRFPGKPLADICGRPMIWWVYQQCKKVEDGNDVEDTGDCFVRHVLQFCDLVDGYHFSKLEADIGNKGIGHLVEVIEWLIE